MKNKVLNRYFKKVRRAFPIVDKMERKFLDEFYTELQVYSESHPDCTSDDYVAQFGTPRAVAQSYFGSLEDDAYYYLLNKSRREKKIITIIIIVLTIALCAYFTWWVIEYIHFANSEVAYIDEIITYS